MNRQEVLRVNHSVFVTYVFPQKPLPKTLTFKDEGKMGELARRSETSAQPTSPQTGFEEQDLPRQMRPPRSTLQHLAFRCLALRPSD
jgi:hypothetical protein